MDVISERAHDEQRTVEFQGHWLEYFQIAIVNLLLTFVTLGIYRFWAIARTRRYLWSRTSLVGSPLEWTGTGGEMFIGFLIVMGILVGSVVAIFGIAFAIGQWFIFVGMLAFYIMILWGIGFAQFRAMRYRLSRTYWRGIRGGSDDSGVNYGWSALGRNFLAGLSLGIAVPWALVSNWNERLNAMSFGDHQTQSFMTTEGLFLRWMGVYGVYIGFIAFTFATGTLDPKPAAEPALSSLLPVLALAVGLSVALLGFWALYFRKAAEGFEWAGVTASFSAGSLDWIKLYAKIVGLTIVTLGVGALMAHYLRWKFVMERLDLYGEIHVSQIGQSTTRAPKDAEGFADAFDIGAF